MGHYQEALDFGLIALELSQKGTPKHAIYRNNIGVIYWYFGDYRQAHDHYLLALKETEEIYGGGGLEVAPFLDNVSHALSQLGKLKDALDCSLEALEIRQTKMKNKDGPALARSLNSVATIYEDLGDYEKAHLFYKDSLKMRRRLFKEDHVELATSLNNKGVILGKLNRHEKSLKYYLLGLEMKKRLFGPEHSEVATSLSNAGEACLELKRYEDALDYHKKALKMRLKIYKDQKHPRLVQSYGYMGWTLDLMGKREKSLTYFDLGLDMARELYRDHPHADWGYLLSQKARALTHLGRLQEAKDCYGDALEKFRAYYQNETHPEIIKLKEEIREFSKKEQA